jgi:hypothetical protein
MVAGTRIIRTSVASMNTADARPMPNSFSTRRSPSTNDPNTHTMIAAAAVMTRAVPARPLTMAWVLLPVANQVSRIRATRQTS